MFWGAIEPAGHAWAQSLQNFAIFARSDVCAKFGEFSSILSPSKMPFQQVWALRVRALIKAASSNERAFAVSCTPGVAAAVVSWQEAGRHGFEFFVSVGHCLSEINVTSFVYYVALENTH